MPGLHANPDANRGVNLITNLVTFSVFAGAGALMLKVMFRLLSAQPLPSFDIEHFQHSIGIYTTKSSHALDQYKKVITTVSDTVAADTSMGFAKSVVIFIHFATVFLFWNIIRTLPFLLKLVVRTLHSLFRLV